MKSNVAILFTGAAFINCAMASFVNVSLYVTNGGSNKYAVSGSIKQTWTGSENPFGLVGTPNLMSISARTTTNPAAPVVLFGGRQRLGVVDELIGAGAGETLIIKIGTNLGTKKALAAELRLQAGSFPAKAVVNLMNGNALAKTETIELPNNAVTTRSVVSETPFDTIVLTALQGTYGLLGFANMVTFSTVEVDNSLKIVGDSTIGNKNLTVDLGTKSLGVGGTATLNGIGTPVLTYYKNGNQVGTEQFNPTTYVTVANVYTLMFGYSIGDFDKVEFSALQSGTTFSLNGLTIYLKPRT